LWSKQVLLETQFRCLSDLGNKFREIATFNVTKTTPYVFTLQNKNYHCSFHHCSFHRSWPFHKNWYIYKYIISNIVTILVATIIISTQGRTTQGRTDNEIKINLARECSLDKEKHENHSPEFLPWINNESVCLWGRIEMKVLREKRKVVIGFGMAMCINKRE